MDNKKEIQFPLSPFAKYQGELHLGDKTVDCYVLDTKERVISLRASVKALTDVSGGDLERYIGVQALKPFINKELILEQTVEFNIPGSQWKGRGIIAERFLDICNAYVKAFSVGALTTERQQEIAINCSILLSSCAKVGLIALIDEATGYQYEREEDALQIKLKAFIAEELRDWEKTFPDGLWEQFGRLTNWQGALHLRPKWWGKLVMELIYYALDPDIANHLRTNKPPPRHGMNYHQWLTSDVGLKALIPHIHEVIGIAKTCDNMRELRDKVALYYNVDPKKLPKKPITVPESQISLFIQDSEAEAIKISQHIIKNIQILVEDSDSVKQFEEFDDPQNKKYKHISRIDTGRTHGWYFRILVRGDAHSKLFSDSKYEGSDTALQKCIQYRNDFVSPELLKKRLSFRTKPTSRSITGVAGVAKTFSRRKNGKSYHFNVTWRFPGEKRKCKSFPFEKYGGEKKAFEKAVALRKEKESEMLKRQNNRKD